MKITYVAIGGHVAYHFTPFIYKRELNQYYCGREYIYIYQIYYAQALWVNKQYFKPRLESDLKSDKILSYLQPP